jgi:hypothetical protein
MSRTTRRTLGQLREPRSFAEGEEPRQAGRIHGCYRPAMPACGNQYEFRVAQHAEIHSTRPVPLGSLT